jgi:hypothetical protein
VLELDVALHCASKFHEGIWSCMEVHWEETGRVSASWTLFQLVRQTNLQQRSGGLHIWEGGCMREITDDGGINIHDETDVYPLLSSNSKDILLARN